MALARAFTSEGLASLDRFGMEPVWHIFKECIAMPKYPKNLSPEDTKEVIRRRGGDSDKSGKKGDLEIHHRDRNPRNNDPRNLRVLTKKEHRDLHARDG
ncbi:unnamed protein product [marine sediment metagenome]|uniref:HNH nuclease domain-containing protein n=1 Tax=marine sediment metagenome TaxID=412755 RepID=X0YZX3_9ZZZZ